MAELRRSDKAPDGPKVLIHEGTGTVSAALRTGDDLAAGFGEHLVVVVVGRPSGQWRGSEPFQIYLTAAESSTLSQQDLEQLAGRRMAA